mgnify:FL=1
MTVVFDPSLKGVLHADDNDDHVKRCAQIAKFGVEITKLWKGKLNFFSNLFDYNFVDKINRFFQSFPIIAWN